MNIQLEDTVKAYLRELSVHRNLFAACFFLVAALSIAGVLNFPKSYTSSATIYGDNSNILRPLMEGNAVPTGIENQAQMAREILFQRKFDEEILRTGGWDPAQMTQIQIEEQIRKIQENTQITTVGRSSTSLLEIVYTDQDPVRAYQIAQKYTSLFIEESVTRKQSESRDAFQFIQNQVDSYQQKLKESEERLSRFKSTNNYGTLASANNRLARYQAEIERLELDLVQLDTQEQSVVEQLAGQQQVSRDLGEVNALRSRINSLQRQLDTLRSFYRDSYPDVVQLKTQIEDLKAQLATGRNRDVILGGDQLDRQEGVTPLHQELRSRLAAIRTERQSKLSQLEGIRSLLTREQGNIARINQSEAELAELTRDYNVTQDFYNNLLKRLENARVSMQLDVEKQGIAFKVQESAVIPTQPDGLMFRELLAGSFLLSLGVPFILLVVSMEADTRVRSGSSWQKDWPPLLMSVPQLKSIRKRWISDKWYLFLFLFLALSLYGTVAAFYVLYELQG